MTQGIEELESESHGYKKYMMIQSLFLSGPVVKISIIPFDLLASINLTYFYELIILKTETIGIPLKRQKTQSLPIY